MGKGSVEEGVKLSGVAHGRVRKGWKGPPAPSRAPAQRAELPWGAVQHWLPAC